jgi:hypothetical protein
MLNEKEKPVPPAVTANASMLRMIALQIDNAIVQATGIPDYLRDSGKKFAEDMRTFCDELDEIESKKT